MVHDMLQLQWQTNRKSYITVHGLLNGVIFDGVRWMTLKQDFKGTPLLDV